MPEGHIAERYEYATLHLFQLIVGPPPAGGGPAEMEFCYVVQGRSERETGRYESEWELKNRLGDLGWFIDNGRFHSGEWPPDWCVEAVNAQTGHLYRPNNWYTEYWMRRRYVLSPRDSGA